MATRRRMPELRIVVVLALLSVIQTRAETRVNNSTTEWHNWSSERNGTNIRLLAAPEGFRVPLDDESMVLATLIISTDDILNVDVTVKMTHSKNIPMVGNVTVTPCNRTMDLTDIIRTTGPQNSSLPVYTDVSDFTLSKCYNVSFKVQGLLLGYSEADFTLHYTNSEGKNRTESVGRIQATCYRRQRIVDMIFIIVIFIMISFAMLAMGATIKFPIIKEHLKKPKAPICAVLSQYTFMPLVSYALIRIMNYKGSVALGIFLWGCSPGGNMSNMITKLIGGDMSLSVTMTTISTVLSLVMLPLWVYTLGSTLPGNDVTGQINIPYVSMLQSLALIIVPILLGALIQWKAPRVQRFLKKFLKVFFIILIVFMFTVGIYSNLYLYKLMTWQMVLALAVLPFSGFLFGALMAFAFRLKWKIIKTVALETGMQNTGVAILVLQASLTTPDRELAMVAPLSATLGLMVPMYIAVAVYLIYRRCCAKNEDTGSESGEDRSEELQDMSETEKLKVTPDDLENSSETPVSDDAPPDYTAAANSAEFKELI